MLELLLVGLALVCGLLLLVALPLLLLGAVFKVLLAVLLLPFRLLGMAAGGLFKGVFAVVGALAGLLLLVLMVVAFPVAILVIAGLVVAGLVKLVFGAAVGATA